MSNYTTELRFICETYAGLKESTDLKGVNEVIALSIPKIFDFAFPIFDENYRNVLCTKILKHYYTREICCETVGRWKLFLDTRLNEIMPMYNKLYSAVSQKINPLHDFDMTTEHSGTVNEVANKQSTHSGTAANSDRTEHDVTTDNTDNTQVITKYSDTPQGGLSDILSGEYLTSATVNSTENVSRTNADEVYINRSDKQSNDNMVSDDKINTTDSYVTHVFGKSHGVSYGKAIKEFADNLIDVDLKIINELDDLFMQIW